MVINNGLIISWQISNPNLGSFIYFPITFTNNCFNIVCQHWFADGTAENRSITVTYLNNACCYIATSNNLCTVFSINIGN